MLLLHMITHYLRPKIQQIESKRKRRTNNATPKQEKKK